MLEKVDVQSIRDLVPHGTPREVARIVKGFCDAGLRVPKILDYGGMAGLQYAAESPQKVRATEDELMRLVEA
jgi:phthiodiolone/phenolphthiodiolone dimycocerosates ketoreductase